MQEALLSLISFASWKKPWGTYKDAQLSSYFCFAKIIQKIPCNGGQLAPQRVVVSSLTTTKLVPPLLHPTLHKVLPLAAKTGIYSELSSDKVSGNLSPYPTRDHRMYWHAISPRGTDNTTVIPPHCVVLVVHTFVLRGWMGCYAPPRP